MRKISEDSAKALLNGKAFKRDNTQVTISDNREVSYLYLFGNLIAKHNFINGSVSITDCGYPTVTTKDRLNAVIYYLYNSLGVHIPYRGIYQKNYNWYIRTNNLICKHNNCDDDIEWVGGWFPLVGDDIPKPDNNQLKTVSMVSAMFNIMCADDTKTSNKYQKRFLNTVEGINFPDDWENLSEVEKSKRLNKAVKVNL